MDGYVCFICGQSLGWDRPSNCCSAQCLQQWAERIEVEIPGHTIVLRDGMGTIVLKSDQKKATDARLKNNAYSAPGPAERKGVEPC